MIQGFSYQNFRDWLVVNKLSNKSIHLNLNYTLWVKDKIHYLKIEIIKEFYLYIF